MAVTIDGTNGINNGDADITNVGDIAVDSISGDADSNTKITFEGSDVISFDTGGSEIARFDDNGHLGIGVTDPNAGMLVLTKSSDGGFGGSLVLENSNASDTDKVIIAMRPNGSATTAAGSYGENRIISEFDSGSTNGASNMQFWTHAGVGTVAERMRIDSNGNLLLGTTSTYSTVGSGKSVYIANNSDQATLRVSNADPGSPAYGLISFHRNGGSPIAKITTDGSTVSYNTSSDYRLKENVVDMTDAIDRVKALPVRRFNFISNPDTTVDGFLAHEAQSVVPEAVTGTHDEVDDDGNAVYQGIDQAKLVPLLTGALKEAIAKIETLETTVADLQTRVTALEAN